MFAKIAVFNAKRAYSEQISHFTATDLGLQLLLEIDRSKELW